MTGPRPSPAAPGPAPVWTGRFFLPGPTEVHPEVLLAQARAVFGHRGPAMQELMRTVQTGLQTLFDTELPVIVSTSSATGLMEAGIRNAGAERVLSLVNGAFSERFARIAEACGAAVERLEVSWGECHDPAAVAQAVGGGTFSAVTVVHSETSTGALNPVAEIADALRATPDVLILVDSVSGLGGAELHMDREGYDYLLTGSQKALALPPGLAFAAASPRMSARAAGSRGRGFYFDLDAHLGSLRTDEPPTTPAVTLLFALEAQLRRLDLEGVEARWARHAEMARLCWSWVDRRRAEGSTIGVLAPPGHRSPTVTCLQLPTELRGSVVASRMEERGFVIAPGYGPLRESTIRIGHMGDHTVQELEILLEALADVLDGG